MAKDTDFLYVSARIKFLETKLLGKSAIERILIHQDRMKH